MPDPTLTAGARRQPRAAWSPLGAPGARNRTEAPAPPPARRWRRRAAVAAAVVTIGCAIFGAVWMWLGPDVVPMIVAAEITLTPDTASSRAVTFDAVVFDERRGRDDEGLTTPRALLLTLPRDGCDALTLAPEGGAATAPPAPVAGAVKVNVVPASTLAATGADPAAAPCSIRVRRLPASPLPAASVAPKELTSLQSEPLWVATAGAGGAPTPLLTHKALSRLRVVGRPTPPGPGAGALALAASGGAPPPADEPPSRPAIVMEGPGLAIAGSVFLEGDQARLAVRARARRLTRFEIDGESRLACWRWRKALTAATFFLVPAVVDRSLRALGASCVEQWTP